MRALVMFVTAAAFGLMLMVAPSARADPDSPASTSGVTDPALSALINSMGNDLFSTADLTTVLDPTVTNTQHYGPYASTSTDSGTCGNDWANDAFDRHFTVHHNPDGTFSVVEQFKDGSFVTVAGSSPGACQPPASGGMVTAGITGSLHGYFIIPLPPGEMQTSTSPFCNATTMTNTNCDTATFINTHFMPMCYSGTCPVTTFFFHYSAGDQGLIQHEWKNASDDRGGNSGDIRSS